MVQEIKNEIIGNNNLELYAFGYSNLKTLRFMLVDKWLTLKKCIEENQIILSTDKDEILVE